MGWTPILAYCTQSGSRKLWQVQVSGSGVEHDYAGVIEDSFGLRVGEAGKFILSGLQVIEHPFPLFLLGADVFFCGEKRQQVGTMRAFPSKDPGTGTVSGSVRFNHESEVEEVPFAQAAQVQGPAWAGQSGGITAMMGT